MREDRRQHQETLDRFAELLSLDLPMDTIRQRLGLTKSNSSALLQKLRKQLGWQAR